MCLPNEEYIPSHWFEGTNMAAKCEICMNWSKTLMAVKHIWMPKQEIFKELYMWRKKIWLTNVKYLSLNTSLALAFCIDGNKCTISKLLL